MHLNVSEIKKLLKKWHFYKAITLKDKDTELSKKLETIESKIRMLDDVSKEIMRMKYFDGYDVHTIASSVYMSRQGVYYRLNIAYKEIEYLANNTL